MNLRRICLVSPVSLPLKMQKYKGAVYNQRHVSVNVSDVEVFTWFTITVGHVGHVSRRCWMTWPHVTPVELSWMSSELQMAILQSGITIIIFYKKYLRQIKYICLCLAVAANRRWCRWSWIIKHVARKCNTRYSQSIVLLE